MSSGESQALLILKIQLTIKPQQSYQFQFPFLNFQQSIEFQDRGLFGDVIGGILGGDNGTADATTPANADAPSDIVSVQYIPSDIVNIEYID